MEIYQRVHHKGIWSQPKPILSVNIEGKYITVDGKKGSTITVGIEDVRKAMNNNELSQLVSDGIDKIDLEISDLTENILNNKDHKNSDKN